MKKSKTLSENLMQNPATTSSTKSSSMLMRMKHSASAENLDDPSASYSGHNGALHEDEIEGEGYDDEEIAQMVSHYGMMKAEALAKGWKIPPPPWEVYPEKFGGRASGSTFQNAAGPHEYHHDGSLDAIGGGGGESPSAGSGSQNLDYEPEEVHQVSIGFEL